MNKNIVIYRYHNNFELVYQRLKLIKLYDPEIKIYGIYGGNKDAFQEATNTLAEFLENNFIIPIEDGRWKWLHADLTYKLWYSQIGKHIDFDFAFILEWDLLIMGSLTDIYPPLEADTLYCTGLIPIEKIKRFWFWTDVNNKPLIDSFVDKTQNLFKKKIIPYASLGPGLCAPKSFFEGLLNLEIFEAYITDEVKIPIWAQIIGLKIKNNNFYNKWFSYFEMKYFNANVLNISDKVVSKEMTKKNGRHAFHPYREGTSAEELYSLYLSSKPQKCSKVKDVNVIHPSTYRIHCKLLKM
ncbi:MAG: hypothetical protein IPO21_01885 [Bacteroidales bacterium]|nr:hypothetical protein [Bacteroidales bacterium]